MHKREHSNTGRLNDFRVVPNRRGLFRALMLTVQAAAILVIATPAFCQSTPGTVVCVGLLPQPPAGLSNVVAVSGGHSRAAALLSDGTVAGWDFLPGNHNYNTISNAVAVAVGGMDRGYALLNDGTVVPLFTSGEVAIPAGLSNVVAISSGELNTCALKADGTVVLWGVGAMAPPVPITNAIAVSSGFLRTLALRSDGTVTNWGVASGTINSASNVLAVCAGYNFLALQSDGTVTDLSTNASGGVPAGLSNVAALASGSMLSNPGNTLALKQDGTVVGWGSPATPAGLQHISAMAAGYQFSLFVSAWPMITVPPQSTNVNGGATASFSTVALGAGPFTYQWQKDGTNLNGQTGTNLVVTNAQASDGGNYTVVVSNTAGAVTSPAAALTVNTGPSIVGQLSSQVLFAGAKVVFSLGATGSLPLTYQWLHNTTNLPGETNPTLVLNDVQNSDAGSYALVVSNSYGSATSGSANVTLVSHTMSYPPAGTVVSIGGPILPPDLTNVVAIAAGQSRGVALRSDGTVTGWGGPPQALTYAAISNAVAVTMGGLDKGYALLADGTVARVTSNVDMLPPDNLFGVVAISAGEFDTLALKADGTVVAWGGGNPTPPSNVSNVVAVSPGLLNLLALRSDGNVLSWPVAGGVPGLLPASNAVAVAAGREYFALRNDGTVQDLSTNASGGVPGGLSNVMALSTGYGHTLALKADGTAVGWGNQSIPTNLNNIAAVAAGSGFSLLLSTNPPPPMLGAAMLPGALRLSTPVAVSGYVFEATDALSQPYQTINIFTNAIDMSDTNNPAFALPLTGPHKYYRLRKLQ